MDQAPHTLECSEVWGGNDEADRVVVMQGLDAWVLSRPCEGDPAGGDIHYLSSCATGRISRILIADVSGHGSTVADLALRLRSLMRRYVNYVDPARLVGRINREFAGLTDGGRFATAVVATLWGPTGELTITNAGHPPPLLFQASTGRWRYLDDRALPQEAIQDIPLGITDATEYRPFGLTLSPGDMLLLYTDALIEARSPAGEQLGPAGLSRLVEQAGQGPAGGLLRRVLDAVQEFTGGLPPDDDATLLLLRPNAIRPPEGSFALGIKATARLLREFASSLRRGAQRFAWPEARTDNFLGAWFDRFNRRRGKGGGGPR
jgi:phosphoserine phosphatase RsbU/P